MLLDQQKTKRMVKIVSIICAVAFVGVLPVVLGLVLFGDSGASQGQNQLIDEAKKEVAANPNTIGPLIDLAAQYRAANRLQEATATIATAIAIGPSNGEDLELLVGSLSDQPGQQLSILQAYTKKNPKDGEAWYTYGSTAERIGQVVTARLAYQQALTNAKKGTTLAENAEVALERLKNTPAAPTPSQPPPTATAPVTPVTPATP